MLSCGTPKLEKQTIVEKRSKRWSHPHGPPKKIGNPSSDVNWRGVVVHHRNLSLQNHQSVRARNDVDVVVEAGEGQSAPRS